MAITYRGERFSGYNKPKRTPGHKTKSHAVLAKEGNKVKLVRFGQQGVKGAGKNPKTKKDKARKRSYYARHNAQGKPTTKLSAKYWSHKVKW
jgi:hypothetical protein